MSELPKSRVLEPSTSQPSTSSTLQFTALDLDEFKALITDSMKAMLDVVRKAQDVSINGNIIKFWSLNVLTDLVREVGNVPLTPKQFRIKRNLIYNFPAKVKNKVIDILFVMNTLNFNLWYSQNAKQWTVRNQTGYKALYFAFERAVEENRPMWDPNYYSNLEEADLEIIFRGDDGQTKIPLIHERLRILREIGAVLMDNYGGTFVNCINACDESAVKLLHLLYNKFESYRDTVDYKGKKVFFGCKAITLVSDLSDIKKVEIDLNYVPPIFVDYCVPRLLLQMDILRYTHKLRAKFTNSDEPLEHGSREDIEIRCCTLMACKMLANMLSLSSKDFFRAQIPISRTFVNESLATLINTHSSNIIANFLWHYRHMTTTWGNEVKLHNIRSLYY